MKHVPDVVFCISYLLPKVCNLRSNSVHLYSLSFIISTVAFSLSLFDGSEEIDEDAIWQKEEEVKKNVFMFLLNGFYTVD